MKCPKCSYLGFETGDRCKNCGYDFSLMAAPADADTLDVDLALRSFDDGAPQAASWDDRFTRASSTPPSPLETPDQVFPSAAPPAPRAERADRAFPLFGSTAGEASDEPMIRMPATPSRPLAVRRTPDTPRLRAVPKPSRPIASAPALEFLDEAPPRPINESAADVRARTAARLAPPLPLPADSEVSGAGARLSAASIDHLLLSAIDVGVVYFTLRMTGLTMADWTALPAVPLFAFLLLVKLSYFCAFTAVGGQTIGKMAARIRVVTTENASVDGALAIKRTLAGAVSAALLGLGYLPALIGSDRRALHDRVTHTRVIALPSV